MCRRSALKEVDTMAGHIIKHALASKTLQVTSYITTEKIKTHGKQNL